MIIRMITLLLSNSEPEKTMGPSGVRPIAVLKEESNVKIVVPVFSFLVTYILKCDYS